MGFENETELKDILRYIRRKDQIKFDKFAITEKKLIDPRLWKKNNCSVIIQARYNSKRLEGKVLKKIGNKTILEILIEIKQSKLIDQIIVACPNSKIIKKLLTFAKKKIKYFLDLKII